MIIVNLIGSPGVGKSTLAAKIFHKLKIKGYLVELVTEFAKDLLYEDNHNLLNSQIQVFAKQHWRVKRLAKKVDIIITDSPILLSILYYKESNPHFKDMVLFEYNQFDNMTYYLNRSDDIPYQEHGRYQTLEQAQELDGEILNILQTNNIDYQSIDVNGASKKIIRDIIAKLSQ